MTKSKLNKIFMGILIALNIGLMAFIFLGKPPHHGKPPKKIIGEKLNFSSEQMDAYEKLIVVHKSEINDQEVLLKKAKKDLYNQLALDSESSEKDQLLASISKIKATIEGIHFSHFEDIKSLCSDIQKPSFVALCPELSQIFSRSHPPKKRD